MGVTVCAAAQPCMWAAGLAPGGETTLLPLWRTGVAVMNSN